MYVCVCTGSDDCSRSYLGRVGSVGHVSSPNFPFDYADNLTCRSTIYVNDSTASTTSTLTVCLTFYRFQLEASSPFCSFDYVELRTGSESRVKYCGAGVWQYGVVDAANPLSNVWSSPLCCESQILYIIEELSVCVCVCVLNRLLNHATEVDQTVLKVVSKSREVHCQQLKISRT